MNKLSPSGGRITHSSSKDSSSSSGFTLKISNTNIFKAFITSRTRKLPNRKTAIFWIIKPPA